MRRPELLAAAFLLSCLAGACGAPAAEAATEAQAAPQAAAQAARPAASVQPAVPDYEIGPEDILKVTVFGNDDLTQTLIVQADGTFTFPLIGRVKAEGLTVKQLEQKITTLLAKGFIRNPQVTAVVHEVRSKTLFVVGEIARPGTYPLAGKMTLVEVLAKAGPVSQNAGAEVVVMRPPAGKAVQGPLLPGEEGAAADPEAEVIRVNLRELQAGALEKNLELKPNDTVFVPQAPKVFVSGEVRNPGAYSWFPGMTARQLISVAGGLTPEGSNNRLKVVRTHEGKSNENGVKLDEGVKAGETLVVRRRLF